jgi:hypothetical protein
MRHRIVASPRTHTAIEYSSKSPFKDTSGSQRRRPAKKKKVSVRRKMHFGAKKHPGTFSMTFPHIYR